MPVMLSILIILFYFYTVPPYTVHPLPNERSKKLLVAAQV